MCLPSRPYRRKAQAADYPLLHVLTFLSPRQSDPTSGIERREVLTNLPRQATVNTRSYLTHDNFRSRLLFFNVVFLQPHLLHLYHHYPYPYHASYFFCRCSSGLVLALAPQSAIGNP